jgi:hypothetical protein
MGFGGRDAAGALICSRDGIRSARGVRAGSPDATAVIPFTMIDSLPSPQLPAAKICLAGEHHRQGAAIAIATHALDLHAGRDGLAQGRGGRLRSSLITDRTRLRIRSASPITRIVGSVDPEQPDALRSCTNGVAIDHANGGRKCGESQSDKQHGSGLTAATSRATALEHQPLPTTAPHRPTAEATGCDIRFAFGAASG